MDDVQFLNGKEQTQEAFFHTFNDLHTGSYQIVMTSDRPPKALTLTEDRLRSRYEWGLIADIQPPDLETRIAILAAKADDLQIAVEPPVLELIAKRVQKNVRELEGSLNRVVAYAQLLNAPITLESTSRLLDDMTLDTARHAIDPERILEQVSRRYKVSPADLLGRNRSKTIALARPGSHVSADLRTGTFPHRSGAACWAAATIPPSSTAPAKSTANSTRTTNSAKMC